MQPAGHAPISSGRCCTSTEACQQHAGPAGYSRWHASHTGRPVCSGLAQGSTVVALLSAWHAGAQSGAGPHLQCTWSALNFAGSGQTPGAKPRASADDSVLWVMRASAVVNRVAQTISMHSKGTLHERVFSPLWVIAEHAPCSAGGLAKCTPSPAPVPRAAHARPCRQQNAAPSDKCNRCHAHQIRSAGQACTCQGASTISGLRCLVCSLAAGSPIVSSGCTAAGSRVT